MEKWNHLKPSIPAELQTDGAPSVKGKESGLGLINTSADISNIIDFSLHNTPGGTCGCGLQNVMLLVVIVNFKVSVNNPQFRGLLEEYGTEYGDLEKSFHVPVSSSLTHVIQDLCHNHAAVQWETVEFQANDIRQAELIPVIITFETWFLIQIIQLRRNVSKKWCHFSLVHTYESTFSTRNIVKKKQRNRLSTAHLACLTRVAVINDKYSREKVKMELLHFRSSNL